LNPNSETCVDQSKQARGALLRGLDGSSVNERRARRYYGTIFNASYQAGNGYDNYKIWSEASEKWMVLGAIKWYIKRVFILVMPGRTVSNLSRERLSGRLYQKRSNL
jgi:hypothetical protein